jgi:hypothetical protein
MPRKTKQYTLQELTEAFRKLGARNPELSARSQMTEGVPRFAMLAFLRQAWKYVIDEDDESWIDDLVNNADEKRNEPCSGLGPAVKRMLAAGVPRADIVDVVRITQYQLLFNLCYQLSDPSEVDFLDSTMPPVDWKLFEVNAKGEALAPMDGLYESVLSLDPTGREMCPRK